MKKIGFVDYYLDEWHAQQYPDWIRQASGGEMEVAYAYGKIDKANGMRNADWCRDKGIQLLDSIEEVVAKSDYLVVLSPDNPEQHEVLASLPLKSGKPTYIDKTFAPDRATAMRLFAAAEHHGTPLYSSSALRFAAEYAETYRQGIERISSIGPGKYDNYSIHQIEPIVSLMGAEAQRIMYIGTENSPALLIEFSGDRQAEIRHMDNSPFSLAVGYASGAFVSLKAESDFFTAFIQNMVNFFRTGKPTVDPKETIAIVTLIEYGAKAALTPFRWVELP